MKSAALAVALAAGSAAIGPDASAQDASLRQREHALVETLRSEWAVRKAAGLTPATLTEPSLTAGAVLTPSVDVGVAPGVPALQITLRSGTVGLSSFIATMTSPDGLHGISTSFLSPPAYPSEPGRQTIRFDIASPFSNQGFGLYTEPGNWTLSNLAFFTKDGQIVEYGPGQLSALFTSTTVNIINKGTPDVTPPAAMKGMILTPTVSLGSAAPIFAARLNVKDDVSGVANVNLEIAGPSGSGFTTGAYVAPLYPVTRGSVVPMAQVAQGSPVGTYTITSVTVCDVAQNCTFDTSAVDIMALFGTNTFTVTD